ncbi:MAG: phosphotransferase [Gammaproteobacteria bacterium]|nr:phosphotransferase [Gammaproteobacteria bacterium]
MSRQSIAEIVLWASNFVSLDPHAIQQLKTEASTRRFWRCRAKTRSVVLMDSPPSTENNEQFLRLANIFLTASIPVPRVIASDLNKGFFIIEDVGMSDFHAEYTKGRVNECLRLAVDVLHTIQQINSEHIPSYSNERLCTELKIFEEFICNSMLEISARPLQNSTETILNIIRSAPNVTVHRDFHCRNLLVRAEPPGIGVVDFQDALVGPMTYDLASLLYDCYWEHSPVDIQNWAVKFCKQIASNTHWSVSFDNFDRTLKTTAVQRLLKACGIFYRLWVNRQQSSHLQFILPSLQKAYTLCGEIDSLEELHDWLGVEVIPRGQTRLNEHTR